MIVNPRNLGITEHNSLSEGALVNRFFLLNVSCFIDI